MFRVYVNYGLSFFDDNISISICRILLIHNDIGIFQNILKVLNSTVHNMDMKRIHIPTIHVGFDVHYGSNNSHGRFYVHIHTMTNKMHEIYFYCKNEIIGNKLAEE